MIITISGMPGSGKSTVGKILVKKLGYKHYSMGDFYGEIAMARGITIDEILNLAKTDASIDKTIDERQKNISKNEDNIIIDSVLGFHFIPNSLKVFIDVDPKIAGERVFKDQRPDEPRVSSIEEATEMLMSRPKINDERYKKYYGISYMDRSQYDLVIDSSNMTPEEVADKIIEAIKK